MKTSSAKAKGRRACAELREGLLAIAPSLLADDIRVTPSGVTGEDLWLSPRAQEMFPFAIECKNVEKLNIWDAIKQSREHAKKSGRTPLVAFTKNHEEMQVAMSLKVFLSLLDGIMVRNAS